MAGDKFSFRVHSWHNNENYPFPAPDDPLLDLIGALSSGIGGITSNHNGPTVSELANSSVLSNSITSFLNSQGGYDTDKPKAFVNWVLFDNQFRFVAGSSGFEQVGEKGDLTVHTRNNMPVGKSGFLYIYVSNETESSVFFDNLQVTHIRGPLVEENHYYPFGLTMAGISSKALGYGEPANRRKFNDATEFSNKEFSDGSGLEIYETAFRGLDTQLGRFLQMDPLADEFSNSSPYTFANNNPILLNDPLGLYSDTNWINLSSVVLNSKYNIKPGISIINSAGMSIRKNPNHNPYNQYSPSYFKNRAWEQTADGYMTVGMAIQNIAIFVPWGRVIKGVRGMYAAYKARQALRIALLARFAKLSSLEQQIVTEAKLILDAKNMSILRTAYEKGISAEISVGGRTVVYEPSMSASGLTLFSENAFVLGREAFVSNSELGKTVLHELYRLSHSTVRTLGATGPVVKSETNAAFEFASKAIEHLGF